MIMNFYFFDLDGTLEDSRDDMANAANAIRESLGLNLRDINILKKHVNKGMHELYINCFDDYLLNSENYDLAYNKVKQAYEDNYLDNICQNTKCYDGILETIKHLSKNGKIFVVTNKPEKHSRALLKKLELSSYITDIMGGDSCPEMKPSPLPLQVIAKRHGFVFAQDKAYMIGDSTGDVIAGKAFGATTVWCSWGYNLSFGNESPDITVNHPLELLNAL